jgi:potassium efflux system protein
MRAPVERPSDAAIAVSLQCLPVAARVVLVSLLMGSLVAAGLHRARATEPQAQAPPAADPAEPQALPQGPQAEAPTAASPPGAAPAAATPPSAAPAPPPPAAASETPAVAATKPPPLTLSAEEIRRRLEALDKDDALADEVRARLKQVYADASAALKRVMTGRDQLTALKKAAESAPVRKQAAEAAAARPVELDLPQVERWTPVDQIDAARQKARGLLTALTEQLDTLTATITERRREAKTLPQTIAELEAATAKAAQPPAKDDTLEPMVAEAMLAAHEVTAAAARLDLELARQKLLTYEAENDVLPLEQEQLARRKAMAAEAVETLSRMAAEKKQDVIQTRYDAFRRALETASPERQRQSETTLGIYERWETLAPESRGRVGELVDTRERVARLQAKFDELEALVASDLATGGGLSRSVGYLLSRTRADLPADRTLLERSAAQSRLVDTTQETLARIDGRLSELPRPPVRAEGRPPEDSLDTLERELLEVARADGEAFLTETLIPLGVQQDTLRQKVAAVRSLVDRHLLWVRSDAPLGVADLRRAVAGGRRLVEPKQLQELAVAIVNAVRARPFASAAGLVGVIVLLVLHQWFVKQIVRLGGSVSGRGALRLSPTVEALGFTILAAVPGWLALWVPSWLLTGVNAATSLAEALSTVAWVFLPLALLRQFVRRHGVADAHYGWSNQIIDPLRRAARRAIVVVLPLVFLWRLADVERGLHEEPAAIARLLFMLLMVAVAVVLVPLAHPRRGLVAALVRRRPGGWAARLSWVWQPLAAALPLCLAGVMALGYGYSATQLAGCLARSVGMLLVATVLHGLAVRWLVISRRRILRDELRARALAREQAAREQAEAATPPVAPPINVELTDPSALDVSAITQQTRRLIDAAFFVGVLVGLWWIWSPVLPALGFLERVTLWQQRAADGTVTGVVTLANLLVAVPIVVLTFIAVRNLPGLLEAAILRHLPFDGPSRYAITSLASYTLVGVGLLLTAGTLGLSWGSVQWLAAGLSVGIGFGLQEIVANFICGIILLFEQPIRVGDVVTLDGVTGVVTRIRIRATTVTNWDRQEYIVPNKDLITGRVINWTLTDSTNRLEIRVGVAYGTDTRNACAIIREICDAHPDVLRDPAALITFEAFGDSALLIVVRVYLATLDRRLTVLDDVHTAIHERFANAGIEIAYPQLDIHLRRPKPS